MVLQRLTKNVLAVLTCLITCCGLVSQLDAQQQQRTPAAPRLFNPQDRAISSQYQPRFMRPASSASGGQVINDGYVGQPAMMNGGMVQGGMMQGQTIGAPVSDVIIADGGYVNDGYIEGGFVDGGCDSCGDSCGGDCGGCGPLFDPRDCGVNQDCWFGGLGNILCNTEYFAGVHAFKHQVFQDPQGRPQPENCSFGAHFGFNTGLPLYNLTCGLLSGQVGVNWVNSNLEDGVLATGDRQQTFVTAGLFRRVDYGLQFGAVADILHEEYVSTLDIVQMRAELSWVFGGGSNFGFRWTDNVQDDDGFIGGTFLPRISGQAIDTYRLFYRMNFCNAGYFELFGGKSDEQHTIWGAEVDLPVHNRMAMYAGFNYLAPDDVLPLTDNEAWNLQLGVTYRPRGNDWYKFYHRPLFRVADNGSMVQSRRP